MNILRFKSIIKEYMIFFVLVVIVLIFSISRPETFLTTGNILTIMRQVSMLGITALGMTLVMLVGGFDLSVGSMQGMMGVIIASLMVTYQVSSIASIFITLTIGGLAGLVNGIIITKLKVSPFITTLSTMSIFKGISFAYTGAYPISGFPKTFGSIGQGYIFDTIPIPVVIMIIIFLIGSFFVNKTNIGKNLYAVGGNEEAARLSGINIDNSKILAYIICSVLAAVSGIILASRLNSGQPAAGGGFEFDVITACVLGGVSLQGGVGRLSKVFIGVLIMGILSNGMIIMGIDEYYQWIIKGSVLIMAVALEAIDIRRLNKG